ncbi:MAG: polynucleotide adenylyltransferase, partial [Myxococcota bacterium]
MNETQTPKRSSEAIRRAALAVRAAGGRALIVGGSVRDRLLGRPERDIDLEILGLDLDRLESILADFGRPHRVGRDFQVLKLSGLDVDFSVAERADLDFAEAARRRDLTINSMALDPLTEELLDPHSGRMDLERRVLRATDETRFGDDPLRALRVARMAAELEMQPEPGLLRLCGEQDLVGVAPERIFAELTKLLLDAPRPSRGLECLEQTRVLRFFPELDALRGVPQDPNWHPEGDVWIHTRMAVDRAAEMRQDDEEDMPLMWAVLC